MPLLNMTQDGQFYQTSRDESDGSGFESFPAEADEMGDVAFTSPAKMADKFRQQDLKVASEMQARRQNQIDSLQKRIKDQTKANQRASELEVERDEELRNQNLGQDPRLAEALMQRYSGQLGQEADYAQNEIVGSAWSADGEPDEDIMRGFETITPEDLGLGSLSGMRRSGMGSFWDSISDLASGAAGNALQAVQDAVPDVVTHYIEEATGQNDQPAPPPPRPAPVPMPPQVRVVSSTGAPVTATSQNPGGAPAVSFFNKKVAGLPMPVVLAGGGILGLTLILLLRKK